MITSSKRDGERTSLPVLFLWLMAVVSFSPGAGAQSQASEDRDEGFEKVDPYTKADPAAMEKAGYESFGPFLFSQGIKTEDVEEALGKIQILWVETKHFKIGSTLRTYRTRGDPKEDKRLEEDLKRLKARIPTVKLVKTRIDPWLRLHLYAMRLEEQYADFLARFGLTEADFDPKTKPPDLDMGEGPYLGMELKFTVLVTDKKSGTGRFLRHFLNAETPSWQRWHLLGGSSFLGISAEALKDYNFEGDNALWATIASEMAFNFVEAFRKSGNNAPMWFKAGLGHYYARRIDARCTLSAEGTNTNRDDDAAAQWEPRVYGLVFNKAAKSWKDMAACVRWDELKGQGHLVAWSRVEWLLGRKETNLRELILGITEDLRTVPQADRPKVFQERQEAAFQVALGKTLTDADTEWRKYVLRTYEKK